MSKPAHKNIEHPPGQIVYKILHDHVNPDGTEMTPLNTICNECETVAHCSKSDTSCFRNKGMKLRKEQ